MSKSKRERNYRREEARFTDGSKKTTSNHKHRIEKKVKNLFRSNNIDELMNADFNN